MRLVVTGAAGFIGSTLADRLLADGHEVVGIDSLTDYYDVGTKRRNIDAALEHGRFELVEEDLMTCDLPTILEGVDVVFHQAAQPGVRLSWQHFDRYVRDNILVTQRLLEALRNHPGPSLVYASSSSVYGEASRYPVEESDRPQPNSPYGVTKLAAEHLCGLYARNWDVPTISLRYFTVFGPRQRPDMAFHRLIDAALSGTAFPLLGDGQQERDFTFVDDVVEANVRAATAPSGSVLNIAGGSPCHLADAIATVEELSGRLVQLDRRPAAPGDVRRTGGGATRAMAALDWRPTVSLREGLRRQLEWQASERARR